jgi:CHAT domain-containing protein
MRFTRGADIPALPGARQEAGDVARELNASGWDVLHRYVGAEALEEVVKAERSPRVLHIATHGFFFEAGQYAGSTISGRFSALDDPMMRSGLLFAGAQRVWRGDPPAPGIEDGVLTAKEASTIDLVGTELVVLSACDTGLGDIHDGEGVFGLRRAFQEAGATYVLMSMWEVDDRSTRALMSAFYGHWLHDGMEIHAALRTAESEVRAEIVRENGGRDLQRYWAPFVLAS